MGCAPAGPAGTGKTESTKDLAAALGKACYVFNCSDQMDYQGMAGIFKGLAASGSWGCFDEFNRLVPEVLSVCSVQFKSVTDAIKQGKTRFFLQGDEIALDPSCGAFITMNPGYLGRSELPEGLKALFRPITVVVPDLELICENMLMAEGFVNAKMLAKKFTTLYFLCRDLLSKAAHYDWGLRAIKSVLVVAGAMKRAEPTLPEAAILLRALRDFNIPKIVADDLDIFLGLLGDLFPGINVPRKRDERMEAIIKEVSQEAGLHPDPEFILKIVQLGELLEIRHCVFVMGPAGAGKSSTWRMLGKAQDKDGKKTTI
jgi:dynein heavy chain